MRGGTCQVKSCCMRGIRRLRSTLLGVTARWVIVGGAFAGIAYVFDRVAGPHHGFWGTAAVGAGAFVLVDGAGRTVRAVRRGCGAARAGSHSGPSYEVLPVPGPEVLVLLEQGREIQAIKRYRDLNPGVGLKEAKDVIDGLAGRVL
jgi:hypothetical protein